MKLFNWLFCRIRYEITYFEMEYHLKKVLNGKSNVYLKNVICHRNIGKTSALARLSVKYNIPVAVSTNFQKKLYEKYIPKYIPKYFKYKYPEVYVVDETLRGKNCKIFLVEEGIKEEYFNKILKHTCDCMVGYKNY